MSTTKKLQRDDEKDDANATTSEGTIGSDLPGAREEASVDGVPVPEHLKGCDQYGPRLSMSKHGLKRLTEILQEEPPAILIPPILMLESDVDDGILIPVIVMDAIVIEAMMEEGIDIADEDIPIVLIAMKSADIKRKGFKDLNRSSFTRRLGICKTRPFTPTTGHQGKEKAHARHTCKPQPQTPYPHAATTAIEQERTA